MQQFEDEFERRLEAVNRDATHAATFAYALLAFDYQANDFELRDRLNLHPNFWNAVAGGFQASAFVALGRMFDTRKDTDTASGLLGYAEEHRGIFTRRALAERRIRGGMKSDAAHTFASDAYELPQGGLRLLREALAEQAAFYAAKVAPIRHEVYAHAGKLTRAERDAMFADLSMRRYEELVVFGLRLSRAMQQLYNNGTEPVLQDAPSNIRDVMASLPDEWTSTWDHLHIARATVDAVEWLKKAPLNEE